MASTRKESIERTRKGRMERDIKERDKAKEDRDRKRNAKKTSIERNMQIKIARNKKEKIKADQLRREAEADVRDKRERTVKEFKGNEQTADASISDLDKALSATESARLSTEEKNRKEREAIRKRFKRKGSLNLLSLAEQQKLG